MTDNVITPAMIREAVEKLKANPYQPLKVNAYLLSPQEWELWKEKGII
jgi:hypothetical protein